MDGTGGDWGWAEFDRSAEGTQTWGDAQTTFCSSAPGVAVQIQVAFRPAR
jgi:hypothetical protein